jgi:hypothetical protein
VTRAILRHLVRALKTVPANFTGTVQLTITRDGEVAVKVKEK